MTAGQILTDDERRRLNALFRGLWGNRTGVTGSFAGSSYRYHPTYIRRGALLLAGEGEFAELHVLMPSDATVTPQPECPAAHFNPFPKIDGSHTEIHRYEPGVWWDALRAELPKMEAELVASNLRRAEQARAEQAERSRARNEELARAAAALGEGA